MMGIDDGLLNSHLGKQEMAEAQWEEAQEQANRLLPKLKWGRLTECLSNELQEKVNVLSEEIERELAEMLCNNDTSFLD